MAGPAPSRTRPMVAPVATSEREHDVEAALEALDLARRRFVNVVGHELRTPVTTLRGLSEELVAAPPTTSCASWRRRSCAAPAGWRRCSTISCSPPTSPTALPVGDPEPVDLVACAQADLGRRREPGRARPHRRPRGGRVDAAAERPTRMLERVLDNAHPLRRAAVRRSHAGSDGDRRADHGVERRGPELAARRRAPRLRALLPGRRCGRRRRRGSASGCRSPALWRASTTATCTSSHARGAAST